MTLVLNPEINKDRKELSLEQLSIDYGLTPEQITELALIMFGHCLRFSGTTPLHTVCFVHWNPCPQPGCECGKFFPVIEASFALPLPQPPQGSSEGH